MNDLCPIKPRETVLHFFTGGSDGAIPVAGLIADSAGNLYGTTSYCWTSSDFGKREVVISWVI